jgi:hypothetical protein
VAALLAAGLLASNCGAVRGRRGDPEQSGFLGDYSQLAPREGYEAQEVYVDPDVDWSAYHAIQLDSVTLWMDPDAEKLAEQDRQMLTDLLYKALHEKLGEQFQLVDQPAPGVIRLRAALTQAKGANVPMRTISTLLPQALILGTAVGLSADTARTVGTATVEVEVLDAISVRRLAAVVDSRAGTKSLLTTRTFKKWGDVQAACDFWATRIAAFFARVGVAHKPGYVPSGAQ